MSKKFVLKRSGREIEKPAVDESNFVINYRNTLNGSQYEAASAVNGQYLVIAGAGTGKTRTLVYRVARLIEIGYDPKSILLLTFTRKASQEMMSRAAMLLDSRCSRINGGTFHSFANATLRRFAKHLNLDSNFTILDQSDSEDVINLIRAQLKLNQKKIRFPNKATVNRMLSLSINTNQKITEIIEKDYPHFLNFTDNILKIKKLYESYKYNNSLLDYDDLLIYLDRFLEDFGSGAKTLLSSIKFVMVDEYQDTNHLQANIVKNLTKLNNNVMVVGDDSQSIYSFRGANFKNIMEFPSFFPNAKIIKLEENYRSTQEILNFANHIISSALEKYPKHLFTRQINGELPGIVSASNENMQSRFITERILELREEGIPLSEIAVLFRSSFMSFDLEIELNKANIPYVKYGGMKFIETAHVKDMLAFLRVSENPKDFVSWYRILLLHDGIGPKTAQTIMDNFSNEHMNIAPGAENLIEKKKYKDSITSLFTMIKNVKTKYTLPSDKAEIIFKYYEPIFREKYDDYNKRLKDLEIFINLTQKYKGMETLLTDMALDPPRDSVTDVLPEDHETEHITLSTIHSAKGLEWHSVFIIHALEGFFPSGQAFEKVESLEEERRLMYVASTRAKRNLYVSYPIQIFDRQNGFTFAKPSRFISNISEDLAEEWLLEDESF